ncbi:DUF885 domain-containing protein [Planosporangium sp. 12N6]|uniref:DUF885 domain-containing protein n=1 Tax=Planosporangium spinosum TaxID=3402278 RepID=UPI003CE74F0B
MATTASGLADELLDAFFDAEPGAATLAGIHDRDDRLADHSEAGREAVRARVADIAARAEALDPGALDATDRVTGAVVVQQAKAILDRLASRAVEYTVTDTFAAPATELLFLLPMTGIAERSHADAYLARLARIPEVLAAIADRHRSGITAGRLPVRHLVQAAVAHLDRYLSDRDNDPLRRPKPPAEAAGAFDAERDRLLDELVRPAFARYRDVLATEVLPHGRPADRAGLCWLPDGAATYARLVRVHTTTDRSPQELHRTGLDIVAGLAREYAEIGAAEFGTRDVAEIFTRLRNDPALRWKDGEELLTAARAAISRAEAAAPRWFGRLPGQRCVVEAVPAAEAPGAPGAYYNAPALDGSRPGTYFANTHRAEERNRYSSEATAFHEAVPGHHFQQVLAQELTDLPLLRRLAPFTAYDEGWGLYAERLADEMGLYSDPIARLGMLSADSIRAARLVVDTGLHTMGWSRQQAVDYLRDNTAMSQVEIDSEVDRYIADPGQALAYMVGRLEIQRIRAAAEQALGDRFDIRSFHDTVIGSGPVPLRVLGEIVEAWVAGHR